MTIRSEEVPRLGIEAIDAQHQDIVELVNELHAAALARVGPARVRDLLGRLVDTTQAHFATEEALMVAHDYPAYLDHKADHEKLLAHVIDLERQIRAGDILLSFAVELDLRNWATIHIERGDRALATFLKERGAG